MWRRQRAEDGGATPGSGSGLADKTREAGETRPEILILQRHLEKGRKIDGNRSSQTETRHYNLINCV